MGDTAALMGVALGDVATACGDAGLALGETATGGVALDNRDGADAMPF